MTGRNDTCPCGSGLKYKKCCLFKTVNISANEMYFPPNYSDHPIDFGTIKRIPSYKEYNDIKCDDIVYTKYKEIINDTGINDYLSFPEEAKYNFLKFIKIVCKHKKRYFDLHIQDAEQFRELVCSQNSKKYASCIYWNEIDQYIHLYKIEVFNLIAERVCKISRYFEDVTTSAFIARQVMEATTNSIANQWVLTTCFNMMYRTIAKQDNQVITWKSLEDFVMSLVILPKKYVKDLKKEMPKIVNVELDKDYRVPSYEPTSYQQMEICKYVAYNILDTGYKCDYDIVSSAELLKKFYSRLCKFAHPTPMLYECGYNFVNIDKSEKEYYLKGQILKSLYHSLLLYLNLFESEVFYGYAYTDLIINKYITCKGNIFNSVNLESNIIESIMNKYKDVVISTTEGETIIVKKTDPY